MGYERKNKKIDPRLRLCAKRLKSAFPRFLLVGIWHGKGLIFWQWEMYSTRFLFSQANAKKKP